MTPALSARSVPRVRSASKDRRVLLASRELRAIQARSVLPVLRANVALKEMPVSTVRPVLQASAVIKETPVREAKKERSASAVRQALLASAAKLVRRDQPDPSGIRGRLAQSVPPASAARKAKQD